MGNHDWFIIRSYYLKDDFSNRRWCSTIQGGGWWELLANDEKEEIAFLIGQIPNVIEINNPDNKIGVVHANVPEKMSWGEFTIKIKCSEELQKYSNWNRDRAHGKFKNKFIRGIGHVYFGHTVFDNPTTEGNCTFIDTGSGYECNMDEYYLSNGRLSILEI
jgi:serine/threonine protein phosphatase 1